MEFISSCLPFCPSLVTTIWRIRYNAFPGSRAATTSPGPPRPPNPANPPVAQQQLVPKRTRVHTSSHPSLATAASSPAIDLSLSQNLRRSARLAANCVPAPQSCSPQCHPVLLPRRKRPLIRPIYPPFKRLRLDAGDALHILARASAFSRLACPALHFVAVSSSGCISLANVRLVHDPGGGRC